MIKEFILMVIMLLCVHSKLIFLSGGELTINGAITSNYYDFYVNYTANMKWLAIIWSQNQADTDVTLLKANPSNPSSPVTVVDCYLDQNSAIKTDNIQSLMTSISGFSGDVSSGISMAFKRDLNPGDNQDITIYPNTVIQICFIASLLEFQGNGFQTDNQKVCTYISLHKNVDYYQDRLLGNYAGTSSFGGGNLTFYATQSVDDDSNEPWLFLSVVHKVQGLTGFLPRWLGISYMDTQNNTDMTLIEYTTLGVSLNIHIDDYFIVNATYANDDLSYSQNQGNNDVVKVMSAYDSTSYFVGSYKRKFSTGDLNRDNILTNQDNTFCFIYGNNLAFANFTQVSRACYHFSLGQPYNFYFRQTSTTTVNVQTYVTPPNNVVVVRAFQSRTLMTILFLSLIGMIIL